MLKSITLFHPSMSEMGICWHSGAAQWHLGLYGSILPQQIEQASAKKRAGCVKYVLPNGNSGSMKADAKRIALGILSCIKERGGMAFATGIEIT
jgi:hypothetical protein